MRFLLPYLLLLSTAALAQHPQRRAAPRPERAYYCASGWRVKYHRTESCRGLENCNATVKPLPLGVARKQMEPCRICY
jgi:hypothetical protein